MLNKYIKIQLKSAGRWTMAAELASLGTVTLPQSGSIMSPSRTVMIFAIEGGDSWQKDEPISILFPGIALSRFATVSVLRYPPGYCLVLGIKSPKVWEEKKIAKRFFVLPWQYFHIMGIVAKTE